MDDVDPNQRKPARRTRVLRARDVMPPFDQILPPLDGGSTESAQALPVPGGNSDGGVEGCFVTDAAGGLPPVEAEEIPIYDLAENILAEQRRVAGRRRRGPGRPEERPVVSSRHRSLEFSALDLGVQDLREVQRIIAEIVARDIERLCRRPEQPAYAC